MRTEIVNLKYEPCDIKIDRTSRWGNPYKISNTLSRAQAISLYKQYIIGEILEGNIARDDILAMRGKRLGCWCAPLPCHGDVLVQLLESTDHLPQF